MRGSFGLVRLLSGSGKKRRKNTTEARSVHLIPLQERHLDESGSRRQLNAWSDLECGIVLCERCLHVTYMTKKMKEKTQVILLYFQ